MEKTELVTKSVIIGAVCPEFLKEETLADIFRQTAKKYPNNIALIFGEQMLTYNELDKWTDEIAAYLLKKEIGRGSKVAIWWQRGLHLHAAILGIVKCGAAYVPIDREMPAERAELILAEVMADACFSEEMLNCRCPVMPVLERGADEDFVAITASPLPDDIAYILYTSGSTGKPKGIPISHRQICHLVRAEQSVINVLSSDKVYQGFSVSFDMWCEETWISYFTGATLWVADSTTSKAIDELSNVLNQQKITVLHAVPSLLSVMEQDVPSLRIINAGGEACAPLVVNKWAKPGRRFYNSYGPTETTVSATFTVLEPGDPVTIGTPLPNYNVAVVDEQNNLLPCNEIGELVISGPGVSNGYINLPELTSQKFITKPLSLASMPGEKIYKTGDAVIMNNEGGIDFQGRLDDQVKLRGYRIELGEIESRLNELANINAAAAAVKKDSNGNDHLIGYVVCEDEICMDENVMRTQLAKVLAPYMVPAKIVSLKQMPRMQSGKINRKALPVPESLQQVEDDSAAQLIDLNLPLQDRMLAVLHKTFPGRSIDLSEDFFTDLGGHSLIAAGFVSRMRREAGVPNASLRDVYIHRPVSKLAAEWNQAASVKISVDKKFHKIKNRRYYSCWLAQSAALLFIYGLYAVEIFTPYVGYYYFSEDTGSKWTGILAAVLLYCLVPPVFTIIAVAAKWLVIGKIKEGDYPLWGSYYFRWWFVKTLQSILPAQFMTGTPLYPAYLRLFGAKISPNAQLSNLTIGAEDLLTIGNNASLSSQVVIDNAYVEDGLLKLRSINIGDHCYIGSSAVIAGNTIIEDYGELQDLSYLPANKKIKEGEVWSGSPAQLIEKKQSADIPHPSYVSKRKRLTFNFIFLFALFLFPVFILIPLLPIVVTLHFLDNATPDYDFSYLIVVPALAALYIILFAVETIVITRILNIGIKPGKYSIFSRRYVRKWLSDQCMSVSLIVMHPIYASVYVAGFFRALGAKVGKNTEISTASSVTHPLLQIGDGAFIADAVTLGEADVRSEQLILQKTVIENSSFVGNSALIPQGYQLAANMLIGVLSTPPGTEQLKKHQANDWFGSPAIPLPRRQPSNPFPEKLTSNPPLHRRIFRTFIESVRIILPETAIICFSIFFILFGHDMLVDDPLWRVTLMIPIYYLGFVGLPSLLLTAALKWIFIGRYREEQKPMWTSRVWLSEGITSTYEALCVPFLLNFLKGTPWLPLLLRLFGVKTGKRVWMNTTDVTEFDMVSIGTDSALNEDCGPQTHLFEDRVMKIGTVKIGERTSIGSRTIILYDTTIGNDVKIDSLSLVMKGEVLSPNSNWIGSPVRPA